MRPGEAVTGCNAALWRARPDIEVAVWQLMLASVRYWHKADNFFAAPNVSF
jgi:hypothetical protein